MEARDNEPKIRAIPIEDDDGMPLPDAGGPRRSRASRPRRPWMPLAVSGLAVGILIGAVTFFGAVEFQDPSATDPALFSLTASVDDTSQPTEALPPTLDEMIPGIAERLTLVTTDGISIWTFAWDPTFRVPNEFAMRTHVETEWFAAAFDPSGRLVAATGLSPTESGPPDVWIAAPTEFGSAPYMEQVWSAAWHADVASLAYVSQSEAIVTLETIDIDVPTRTAGPPHVMGTFDDVPAVVRWDERGFILQLGGRTVAMDQAGNESWSAKGWAHAASPNLIAQVRPTALGAMWFLVDRESGEATSLAEFGVEARPEYTSIVASSSSDLFAAATYRDDRPAVTRTSITIVSPTLGAPRIVQVDSHVTPIEFTANNEYLILQDVATHDLVFVDWQTGATHRFPVEKGHRVLAIYLG